MDFREASSMGLRAAPREGPPVRAHQATLPDGGGAAWPIALLRADEEGGARALARLRYVTYRRAARTAELP
jgi:hypothetical protein